MPWQPNPIANGGLLRKGSDQSKGVYDPAVNAGETSWF